MSHHLKSLFQQIKQPLLFQYNLTTTSANKEKQPDTKSNPRRELFPYEQTDSGLENSSSSSTIPKKLPKRQLTSQTCKHCLYRLAQSNDILKKLKQAYLNYVKTNLNESEFANIPMLIVRSFQPNVDSINKIRVKKGMAVNALYMIENKWIYVKTSNEQKGFIPKKCCDLFSLETSGTLKCPHFKTRSKHSRVQKQETPRVKLNNKQQDHTYMTIDNLNNYYNSQKQEYTDLELFSISNHHHHQASDSTTSLEQINVKNINQLRESKSRNRKLSIAIDDIYYNTNTLTMLEKNKNNQKSDILYESLRNFKSLDTNNDESDNNNNKYDYLSEPTTATATTTATSSNSRSETDESLSNQYDILTTMTTTKTPVQTKPSASDIYYNLLNENKYTHLKKKSSLGIYRVVKDYKSSFRGGLSVTKGDLVYLIKQSLDIDPNIKDLVFVRVLKRASKKSRSSSIYENILFDDFKDNGLLQGFIPKDNIVKFNNNNLTNFNSNENSPIYCL